MACKDYEELILRDLDGEMTNPDRIRLRDHFASCTMCKRERELFGRIDEALKKTSAPSPSRRDFASIALEKAEAALASAPRRVRRRVSVAVWATIGIVGSFAVIAAIAGTVYLATRPVVLPPTPRVDLPTRKDDDKTDTKPVEPIKSDQQVKALTPEELKRVYKFGAVDPISELVKVNVSLVSTDSVQRKIELLEKGAVALLDGYEGAMAYGDTVAAGDYAEGLSAILVDGLGPILEEVKDPSMQEALTLLGNSFSDRANLLLKFSQELLLERKLEVQTVIGYFTLVRDAARAAARRK